jgi:hypothetical protein
VAPNNKKQPKLPVNSSKTGAKNEVMITQKDILPIDKPFIDETLVSEV